MKQLKFLMVAFTLLMGVSFTSCLNDDAGESMYDGIGYVRTVMGSYFVDLYGNTYHPTMASVTEMEAQGFKMSGTDLAQIAFKYVEDTPATKAEGGTFTPQDYRIKLSVQLLWILILPDMQVPWKIWRRLYQKLLLL